MLTAERSRRRVGCGSAALCLCGHPFGCGRRLRWTKFESANTILASDELEVKGELEAL